MLKRLLIGTLIPALVAALVVWLGSGLIPKTYSSYESLYFPLNPAGGIGALGPLAGAPSGGDAGAVPGLGGAISYPLIGSGSQTASGIIASHACRLQVAQKLGLDRIWHTTLLGAAKKLSTDVVAETDKTGLLSIQVTSESPSLCVQINQAIYDYLRDRSTALSKGISSGNRKLINERLTAAQTELQSAKAEAIKVMQNTPLSATSDVERNYFEAVNALSTAKINRDSQLAKLNAMEEQFRRLSTSQGLGGQVTALTTVNSTFTNLAQELQERRLQLNDAMISFTSASPTVAAAREKYENALKLSNDVVHGAASPRGVNSSELIAARAAMSSLDQTVTASEEALQSFAKSMKAMPSQYAANTIAKKQFEEALDRVSFLKQELEKSTILEDRDPSRFQVIDEPYEDPVPVGPRRGLYSGLAFVLVAFLTLIPLLLNLVKGFEASAVATSEKETSRAA